MKKMILLVGVLVALSVVWGASVRGQDKYTAPRTAWGDPDLQGQWNSQTSTPLERPLTGALAISGLYDLEPVRLTPFLQGDLRLTPSQVARLSPAFFPRPKAGKLFTTVGGDESEEFLRHNQLIRDQWGPTAVPVCESVSGMNHFTVLESLVDPAGRLHELALRLLGLR